MDEVLRYVVLPFCAKTSDSTRPMMTMPEHTSLESTEKKCYAHRLVSSLVRHVYSFNIGQRVQRIIMASRNLHVFMVYEGIFCSHFIRKITLTPGLLDTVPQQRYWC